MLGRRPILEGVRGCVLLDCDYAVDVICCMLTTKKVSLDFIQRKSCHAEPRTYRLLQGGILLLRTDGYDIFINDWALLHTDLHVLTLGREADCSSSYDGEQNGDGSILEDC